MGGVRCSAEVAHIPVHCCGQRIGPSHSGFHRHKSRGKRTPFAGKKCLEHTVGKCIWKYFKWEENSFRQCAGNEFRAFADDW